MSTKSVKRNKTFTGCWTCRSRKIKCDTTKPECNRCKKTGVPCEGYDIKLQWQKPLNFNPDGSPVVVNNTEENGGSQGYSQRRNVEFVKYPANMLYSSYDDMEHDLNALSNNAISSGDNLTRGPFSMFAQESPSKYRKVIPSSLSMSVVGSQTPQAAKEISKPKSAPSASYQYIPQVSSMSIPISTLPRTSSGLQQNAPPTIHSLMQLRDNVLPFAHDQSHMPMTAGDKKLAELQKIYQLGEKSNGAIKFIDFLKNSEIRKDYRNSVECPKEFVPPHLSPLSDIVTVISPITQFLLNNYLHIIECMTVVYSLRNPWKKLVVPQAASALTDLTAWKSANFPTQCTFNSVLAVSAYNISKSFPQNSAAFDYWKQIGDQARNNAFQFMNKSISEGLCEQKYKSVLISVLALSTVDICNGTMKTSKKTLDLCQTFVRYRMSKKPTLSDKAQALHRIFSFYKTIEESTCVLGESTESGEADDFDLDTNQGIDSQNFRPLAVTPPGTPLQSGSFSLFPSSQSFHSDIGQSMYTPNSSAGSDSDLNSAFRPHKVRPQTADFASLYCSEFLFTLSDGFSAESVPTNSGDIATAFKETIMPSGRISIESIVNEASPKSPQFIEIAGMNGDRNIASQLQSNFKEFPKSEALFGLPNSLMQLFREVVDLFQSKVKYTEKVCKLKALKENGSDQDPEVISFARDIHPRLSSFRKSVFDFETKLSKWKLEWEFASNTEVSDGLQHHIWSFYIGIRVYYYRIVKRVPVARISQDIEQCIMHLEAIERLGCKNKRPVLVPIFWPTFIVACETTDINLQKRFEKWCIALTEMGVNNYRPMLGVIKRIWAMNGENANTTWIHLLLEYDINLILI